MIRLVLISILMVGFVGLSHSCYAQTMGPERLNHFFSKKVNVLIEYLELDENQVIQLQEIKSEMMSDMKKENVLIEVMASKDYRVSMFNSTFDEIDQILDETQRPKFNEFRKMWKQRIIGFNIE